MSIGGAAFLFLTAEYALFFTFLYFLQKAADRFGTSLGRRRAGLVEAAYSTVLIAAAFGIIISDSTMTARESVVIGIVAATLALIHTLISIDLFCGGVRLGILRSIMGVVRCIFPLPILLAPLSLFTWYSVRKE